MSNRSVLEERLRSLDPVADRPSDAQVEAALRRVLVRVSTAETPPRRFWQQISARRRVAFGASLAASAAVATFVVVNLLPASQTSGGITNAWARRVLARVAAAADTGSGILHIVDTTTSTQPGSPFAGTVQSWQEQTAPYSNWRITRQGSATLTTTLSGRTAITYNSATKSLYEVPNAPLDVAFDANDVAYRAVYLFLHQPRPYATLKSVTPVSFGELIVELLKAPKVRVRRDTSVSGRPTISVTARTEYGSLTLYVQPKTYKPEQLVTRDNGGATTETFTTYKTLPTGSVSMPNLKRLHPHAPVTINTFNQSRPTRTTRTTAPNP
jgi:hypothetical protein